MICASWKHIFAYFAWRTFIPSLLIFLFQLLYRLLVSGIIFQLYLATSRSLIWYFILLVTLCYSVSSNIPTIFTFTLFYLFCFRFHWLYYFSQNISLRPSLKSTAACRFLSLCFLAMALLKEKSISIELHARSVYEYVSTKAFPETKEIVQRTDVVISKRNHALKWSQLLKRESILLRELGTEQFVQVMREALAVHTYAMEDGRIWELFVCISCQKVLSSHSAPWCVVLRVGGWL